MNKILKVKTNILWRFDVRYINSNERKSRINMVLLQMNRYKIFQKGKDSSLIYSTLYVFLFFSDFPLYQILSSADNYVIVYTLKII